MKRHFFSLLVSIGVLVASAVPAHAQWLTQSLDLKPGWNAVFLHVNPSHDTLDTLVGSDVGNPILEVWRWNPPSTVQFVESPQQPLDTGSEWSSWVRGHANPGLQRLVGDSAYLVKVGTNVTAYTWLLKGQPVAPRHEWTITGLNLLGFSTVPTGPPTFDTFLAYSPDLQPLTTEIYQYAGGEMGPLNPARVVTFRNTLVKRGQAFWIRAGTVFNRYFGPFEVALAGASGVEFGDHLSTFSVRLRNLTSNNLNVSLQLTGSETPPAGQTPIAAVPPLLVRGSLNLTNLTYGHTNLPVGTPRTWTLAAHDQPGSEVEVILGLNRAAITQEVGALLAGILRFTDSLGQSQVDVPVSATVASSHGLWVGGAAVTQVGHYLKSYERDANGNLITSTNDSTFGQYVITNLNTTLGSVARPFPLRLIVHNPDTTAGGHAVLLQRVYYGFDAATNQIVATQESALNRSFLAQARRISTSHLPWTEANAPWAFDDRLGEATDLNAIVTLNFDDQSSNPFLHTYHPDHDNLDVRFKNALQQGAESYTVRRQITLNVTPPANDFASLTAGGQTVTGDYAERITMLGLARAGNTNETRQFEVRGVFSLNRIADVPTLTTTP